MGGRRRGRSPGSGAREEKRGHGSGVRSCGGGARAAMEGMSEGEGEIERRETRGSGTGAGEGDGVERVLWRGRCGCLAALQGSERER